MATTRRSWTPPRSRPNPRSLTAKHLLTISNPLAAGVLAAVGFCIQPAFTDRFRLAFMANTSSARKAARKIARRTEVNKARRSRMRSALRKVEEAIASGDRNKALEAMKNAEPALMRAARQGQVHREHREPQGFAADPSDRQARQVSSVARLGRSAAFVSNNATIWRPACGACPLARRLSWRCNIVTSRREARPYVFLLIPRLARFGPFRRSVELRVTLCFRSRKCHVDKGFISHAQARSLSLPNFGSTVIGVEFDFFQRPFATN